MDEAVVGPGVSHRLRLLPASAPFRQAVDKPRPDLQKAPGEALLSHAQPNKAQLNSNASSNIIKDRFF